MKKTIILLKLYLSDFKKQRKKIFLTVMAIAWGTVSIILLLAFGEGLKLQIERGSNSLGKGIVIVWGARTSKPFKGLPPGKYIQFKPEDIDFLKNRTDFIGEVGGEYLIWRSNVQYKDKMVDQQLAGVTPSYLDLRNFIPEMGGRFFNQEDMDFKRRVVFLGHKIAKDLFADESPIGKQIMIKGIPFTVIGVMVDKNQTNMYSGPDNEKVIIPLTTFQTLIGRLYLSNIIYKPKKVEYSESAQKELYRIFGGKYKFDPEDKQALSVWDTIENQKIMRNILLGIQIFLGIIGGLTLLVAGVGVANIMYVTVRRRTKEIGVKMALGAKAKYILWEFIFESVSISFIGGALGFLISGIIIKILRGINIENEALIFLGKPTLSVNIALATVIVLGMIAFWSGFFPSRKAAKINPAESLRYE